MATNISNNIISFTSHDVEKENLVVTGRYKLFFDQLDHSVEGRHNVIDNLF